MTAPPSSSHSVHEGVAYTGDDQPVPTENTALISPSPRTASRRTDKRRQEIPNKRSFYEFWAVKLLFVLLAFVAAISTIALVLLILNTGMSSIAQFLPPHRGSRLLPVWFALISAWISLSAVTLFGTPSALTRVSLIASLVLLLLDIILLSAVTQLRRQESALSLITCGVAIISAGTSLGANYVVKHLRDKEGVPIRHGAETVREAELRARLYVAQENYWSNRAARAIKVILSFILTFVTSLALFLITFDICLTAIDSSVLPPFEKSRFHSVQPNPSDWSFKVHLACSGPTSMTPPLGLLNTTASGRGKIRDVPTVLYESMRGVPGSLGGDWVVNLRETGRVGRVCVWDRPGYGFSDNGPSAEMGHVSDALWQALQHEGEEGPYVLVGAGYGGLLTRLFASRHPNDVHSLLYVDSETSHTYFLTRARHNTFFHTHLPILIAPLGLSRIVSLIKNHTPRSARVFANVLQHTEWQNPRLLSTLLQEQYLAHSRQSASFRDLLEVERKYPARRPTIVLSSGDRTSKESTWRDAQRRLWEEIVDEKGRVRWEILEGVGHDVCAKTSEGAVGTGLDACEKAVEDLVWRD
ncbi:alpha/beta hydrolase family protein [Rhizoctonia solani 123E]|uniref:Alpha/beta hydrolase family protein n=1 Tax=Rhizoctonia solani 123E TaxID=1423351 RepID=A0A074S4C0_9AGAM|nr:alpha/beta hydrolase family protein [Rhizoctonia solani 123E]